MSCRLLWTRDTRRMQWSAAGRLPTALQAAGCLQSAFYVYTDLSAKQNKNTTLCGTHLRIPVAAAVVFKVTPAKQLASV